MFSYYGSKSKIVHLYPKPLHSLIIEPFAGSARYALKYFERDVILVDRSEVIVGIWKYLQQCSVKDILDLPEPKLGETINREDFDCIEQAWLMGFLVQQGVSHPMLTVSPYGDGGIPTQKRNISRQLFKIKHWKIVHGTKECLSNTTATYFIDPPYFNGGHKYKYGNKTLDFTELAEWSQSRNGQVIVCENSSADWLPFYYLRKMTGQYQTTTEVFWTNGKVEVQAELF